MNKERGANVELWSIFLRTLFIYFTVLIVMRILGKREVGELSILDLIVSFMIADISSMAIETHLSMTHVLLPIFTLAALQITISFISLKSRKFRQLVDGEPSILIKNGQIQDATMKKIRYNMDDLLMQLRQNNVFNVADVEFAVLETDGELSVFPKRPVELYAKNNESRFRSTVSWGIPIPLIIDGKVQDDGLKEIQQTRFWLKREVQKRGVNDFKDIYFASISSSGDLFIDKKDRGRR